MRVLGSHYRSLTLVSPSLDMPFPLSLSLSLLSVGMSLFSCQNTNKDRID